MSSCLIVVFTFVLVSYTEIDLVFKFKFPRFPQIVGPYNVVLRELYKCEVIDNEMYALGSQLSKNSIGKTVISLNISLKRDYGENESSALDVNLWGNGGWKHFMKESFKSTCTEFLTPILHFEDVQQGLVTYYGLERNKYMDCPIDKGLYTGQNILLENFLKPIRKKIPSLLYGKYRIVFENFSDKKKNMCVVLILDTVPME